MLAFGNKEFRNLQEQVLKNMDDIAAIEGGSLVIGEFGIKVIGQVQTADQLPDPETFEGEYGDAYLVGTETPYDYYIYTRAFENEEYPTWFNIGVFPAPGPQGPAGADGAQGPQGPRGIQGPTGATGPTGLQGPKGDKGDKGDPGEAGAQGPQGPAGITYEIIDTVEDESDLPSPSLVQRNSAYLVGAEAPYDLYVIMGSSTLEWFNAGEVSMGPQGPQGIQGPQGPKGDTGATGATGATGPQGPQGIQGIQGEPGPKGDTGATGAQGPKGDTGDPVTITVNGTTYTQSQGNITLPNYPNGGVWGNITGTLSSQTDLQNALNAKVDAEVVIDEVVGESREITGTISNTGDGIGLDISYGDGTDTHDTYTTINTGADVINLEAGQYFEDENQEISINSSGIEITPNGIALNSEEVTVNGEQVATQSDLPDTSKMVTTDTAQTISGVKTFTNGTIIGNSKAIDFGSGKAWISAHSPTSSTEESTVELRASTYTGSHNGGVKLRSKGGSSWYTDFSPCVTSGDTDLGNSTFKWKNLYLAGNLTDGTNSISVANIVAGVSPSNMVTTDTAQTITGAKTFTKQSSVSPLIFNTTNNHQDFVINALSGYSTIPGLYLGSEDEYKIGVLIREDLPGFEFNLNGSTIASIQGSAIRPGVWDTYDLGTSSYTWRNLYLAGNLSDGTNSVTVSELATKNTYQTTAPTAAIADGGIHIVYLTSEPATKYSGYIYLIAE